MRYVRRLTAALTGCAAWLMVAATIANARPDPGGGVIVYPPDQTSTLATQTSIWEFLAVAGLGALMAIAAVGLVYSLRHRRTSEKSRTSDTSRMSHA